MEEGIGDWGLGIGRGRVGGPRSKTIVLARATEASPKSGQTPHSLLGDVLPQCRQEQGQVLLERGVQGRNFAPLAGGGQFFQADGR